MALGKKLRASLCHGPRPREDRFDPPNGLFGNLGHWNLATGRGNFDLIETVARLRDDRYGPPW
jgi:hypothetical protein